MKITLFEPQLLVKDEEPYIRLFEDLGFKMHHNQQNVEGRDVNGIVMIDENGFRMNIIRIPTLPADSITGIRMNVDNFDEAYEFLTARGFTPPESAHTVDSGSARVIPMFSPSGYLIELVQHIK